MDAKSMIINKLAQYLSKKIQREELYEYAIDMIHKLLKGDIVQLENLEIWEVLTKISEMEDADDCYCVSMAKQYYEVLTGEKNSTFTFAMHIPE